MECRAAGQERNRVLRFLSLELIFSDERCAEALSDEKLLSAMARFEGALATAGAAAGMIPAAEAKVIADTAGRASFDTKKLASQARHAGTLAIPFVKELTAQVAATSAAAARFVHYGATSQDVLDTALALCLRSSCQRISELARELGDAAAQLAQRHAATPMLARTLLQPALPVPFGWKAAMWLAPLARSLPHFRAAATEACVLQFGGAAGTLSAFRQKGEQVAAALSSELGLARAVTWHSARDAFARVGSETAILAGIAGKMARDVSLLMQPEVGEAAEPAAAGRGGSSSMPHKRNPSACMLALEAAQRAPGLAATLLGQLGSEHERGIGQWQSQWLTLRELACGSASALAAMGEVLKGLEVDVDAMRANLERTNGMVFSEALSLRSSRALADRLSAEAARLDRHLLEVARTDPEAQRAIPPGELSELFEPQNAFGSAGAMIERVLAAWATSRESGS
jgi:3-carboxy-cis,cis-muconate cycloisomerase